MFRKRRELCKHRELRERRELHELRERRERRELNLKLKNSSNLTEYVLYPKNKIFPP